MPWMPSATHPQSLAETLSCLIGNLRSISLNPLFPPVTLVKSTLIWRWGSSAANSCLTCCYLELTLLLSLKYCFRKSGTTKLREATYVMAEQPDVLAGFLREEQRLPLILLPLFTPTDLPSPGVHHMMVCSCFVFFFFFAFLNLIYFA